MIKKNIITLVALASLVVPFGAIAQQSDEESSTDSCLILSTPLLRYRMRDATTNGEVSDLQDFLIEKGFLAGDSTGYFGIKTVDSVKKYQASKGIIRTGSVGNLTKAQIKNDTCGDSSGTASSVQEAGRSVTQNTQSDQVNPQPITIRQGAVINIGGQTGVPVAKPVGPVMPSAAVDAYLPAPPKVPTELEIPTLTSLDNNYSDAVVKNVCWMNNTSNFDTLTLKMWVRNPNGEASEFFSDTILRSRPQTTLTKLCTGVRIPLNGKKIFFTLDIANKGGTVRSAPSNEILADISRGETPVVDLPKTTESNIISSMPGSNSDPTIYWKVSQADYCVVYKGSSNGVSLFKKTYESNQKYSSNDTSFVLPAAYANAGTETYTVSCVNTKTSETTEKSTQLTITKY